MRSSGGQSVPGFLVHREKFWDGLRNSVRALFAPGLEPTSMHHLLVVHRVEVGATERDRHSLLASLALHCLAIVLLFQLPYVAARTRPLPDDTASYEKIYYNLDVLETPTAPPRIQPRGEGAHPDEGQFEDLRPALGNDATNRTLAAVSKPLHPDNTRQTIIQPTSPPNLIIRSEVKLPNIIDGMVSAGPNAPSQLVASMAKPVVAERQQQAIATPNIAAPAPATPLAFLPDSGNSKPALPVAPLSAPSARTQAPAQRAAVPNIDSSGPSGTGNGLFIMSVEPAPPSAQIALPPGNRHGEFSVSPEDGLVGSPSGTLSGNYGGGVGGGKDGGNGSVGPGIGNAGGGGGPSAAQGTISAEFVQPGPAGALALDPSFAASMVFPVLASAIPRRNSFVISAGPIGGGSLDVYNALHCGKIYSIFLPMPGKSWTLQYCEHQDTAPAARVVSPSASATGGSKLAPSSTTIIASTPVLPPDPQTRFDFKRLQVPQDQANKMIILKGTLTVDGTIAALTVFQGLVPEMDEAARLAFSRWTFKPAIHDGKAIALDILVGIPPEATSPQATAPAATTVH